jgi:HK97 family phage prohead protease
VSQLTGWFARFGEWTEIRSRREGRFRESIAPGAFKRTFVDDRQYIRALFEHGNDPQVALKPLGTITALREDKLGAYYEVDLYDSTSYVQELMPALQADQFKASFRFEARSEEFVLHPKRSAGNPSGLAERVLTDVKVAELSAVLFPAYRSTSASLRAQGEKPLLPLTGGRLEALDDIPGSGPATVRRLRLAAKKGDENARELVRALERGGRVAVTWSEDRRDGFSFERGRVLEDGRRPAPLRGTTRLSTAGRLPTRRAKSRSWQLP